MFGGGSYVAYGRPAMSFRRDRIRDNGNAGVGKFCRLITLFRPGSVQIGPSTRQSGNRPQDARHP